MNITADMKDRYDIGRSMKTNIAPGLAQILGILLDKEVRLNKKR